MPRSSPKEESGRETIKSLFSGISVSIKRTTISTVTLTPQGMVESGENFYGNIAPSSDWTVETGVMFNGNAPVYQASPVTTRSKGEAD